MAFDSFGICITSAESGIIPAVATDRPTDRLADRLADRPARGPRRIVGTVTIEPKRTTLSVMARVVAPLP